MNLLGAQSAIIGLGNPLQNANKINNRFSENALRPPLQPRDLLNVSVDDMDGGNKEKSTDQFTKMLNLKMHRLSTFRAVGVSGFGGKKTGGSARGSPKAGAGFSALNNSAAIGGMGGGEKTLAEQMFGGASEVSDGSIHRVNEGSSSGPRSLRGSIAGRGSIRSGGNSSGMGTSSLRNKLSKGLQDRFRRNTGIQQITEIEEDKDDDDAETVLDHLENLSDNCPSEGMDTNYDMIGLAQDGNKYQAGVKVALTRYNDTQAADEIQSRAPIDVDKVVKSKSLLAVEIEVYLNMKRDNAILVITEGTLVMLYKSNMGIVINPVHVDNIAKMYIAQNVPSAAALEFKEEVEQKMGRSHLILESPSMGLFLRYLCETTNIEVDFCSQVMTRVGTRQEEFEFEDIPLLKEQEQNAYSSGFVRSVTQIQEMFEFKEGGFMSDNEWLRRHAVITNVGVFLW